MRRRIGFLFSLLAGVLCAASSRADGEGLTWTLGADGVLDGAASPSGRVTLTVTGGEVAAGSGKFFTFLFEDLTAVERVLRRL